MNSTDVSVALDAAVNVTPPARAVPASEPVLLSVPAASPALGLAVPYRSALAVPADPAMTAWRRIALEKQLPRPRFPAGVAVPVRVVAIGLVLLAAACMVFVGGRAPHGVEVAIVDSQKRLATDLAREMNASATYAAAAVADVVSRLGGTPDPLALLNAVEGAVPRWRGGAVMDEVTQTTLAATDQPVPVESVPRPVDGQISFPALGPDASARLVIGHSLPGERLLVVGLGLALRPLRLDAGVPQTILLATGPEQISYNQGTGLYNAAVVDAVRSAVTIAGGRGVASFTGATDGARGTAIVATAVPVGSLGLTVVSVIEAPFLAGAWAWSGVAAAAALIGVTAFAVVIVWCGFVRPVRRLQQSAAAAASGQAEGPSGRRRWSIMPPARSFRAGTRWAGTRWAGTRLAGMRLAETRRIAAALELGSGDDPAVPSHQPRRRGVPASWSAIVATLAILLWSGWVYAAFTRTSPELPANLRVDTQNRVAGVATSLRDMLGNGLAQLTEFAGRQAAAGAGASAASLDELLDAGRFRSVYVLNAGRVITRAGREPLRGATTVPAGSGVHLDDLVERIPAVYAHTQLPSGQTLVAEFDVHALISVLRRLDGRALVVDDRMRTILDTEGYIAFYEPAGSVRHAAALALHVPASGAPAPSDSRDAIVASASIDVPATESTLRWAVVSERRASDLRLAANEQRSHAWLVVLLGACLAGVLLGWHYLVQLRPLRALANAADRLVAGDTRCVVSPSRHDEIGAIAVCLDVCRQARAHGPTRLGGAPRMRGCESDHTIVLPRIVIPIEGP